MIHQLMMICKMCVCCVRLWNTSIFCMSIFLVNLRRKTLLTHSFKSKASLKLIQFDGKTLTGCWCEWVFLSKAISASLYKENWFSSTNRLWIMPWGLVTVTQDCTPVEATSALVVCLIQEKTHSRTIPLSSPGLYWGSALQVRSGRYSHVCAKD